MDTKRRPRTDSERDEDSRARNTGLYIYGSFANQLAALALKKKDVQNYVRNLKGGEQFITESHEWIGERKTDVVIANWTVEKVYPDFVLCIGPGGFRRGFTYADVYFNLNKKGE